jgi:GNAT superfamily N-acetyltransferase
MENITYHKATANDISTLVEYRIRFAIELKGERPPEVVDNLRKQLANYFSQATTNEGCISFIAKNGNDVVGIGSVHIHQMPGNFKNPSGKWGYIMNMYTVPEFRKRGISSRILEELIEAGKKAGVTAFELHSTKTGEPVYLKNGFTFHTEPTLRKYIG